MTTDFTIKIIGLFLGVVARSLIPWLRKLRNGEVKGFDKRYLYSGIATFILGVIITLVIFPQFKGEAGGQGGASGIGIVPDFENYFRLFCLAFGFGFGWNAIVLEAGKWGNWFLEGEE